MSNGGFINLRSTSMWLLLLAFSALLSCGGGDGGTSPTPPPVVVDPPAPEPADPDFSGVDTSFQAFIDERTDFDGISYVLVDAEGVIHQEVFGDHTEDTVALLASTSKVPAVMTLMALQEDTNVDFSMSEPVSTYCLLYTSPSPRDRQKSRMPSSA